MKSIKVIFKDSQYNYVTSISDKATEEEVKKYFLGKWFDMGIFPAENMQQCINVIFI